MPRTLHHLALGAHDVARIAAFYGDLFELPELTRYRYPDGRLRSIWLDLGSSTLMVEHTVEPLRRVDLGAGPFLLAFAVAASERVEFEERLEAQGVTVESRTAFTSYFRDPEGNRVAISHYPER